MRDIYLNQKEAKRLYVMEQLVKGKLTVPQAAKVVGLSTRQVQRLKKGYMSEGVRALAHGNRGRQPAHTLKAKTRQRILELAQSAYHDTSCNHMAELLAHHHHIDVSAKTVARILKAAGIPLRHARKTPKRRRSRDRMPQAGLLVQMDASPFDWLEGRGPYLHLHGAIDDATGAVLGLRFGPQEEAATYMRLLRDQVFVRHGLPRSIYTDRHTMFFSPKRDRLTIEDELAGKQVNLTQLGRAFEALGIQHTPAYSPQAKGRVERLWGTLQSRLVVEMRIANIDTLEQANAFLPAFISRFNERFAVEPKDPTPAFQPAPPPLILDKILAFHHIRKASKGSTVSYGNVTYQLVDQHDHVAALKYRTSVTVIHGLDESLCAFYEGNVYRLRPAPIARRNHPSKINEVKASKPSHKPAPDHPWRQYDRTAATTGPGPIERYVDRILGEDLEAQFWEEIYAQR